MKQEKFPHTRKPLPWWRRGLAVGETSEPRRTEQQRGAEGKVERFPHRESVPTSTHQPERLVCSPTRAGGAWELRLQLGRSDPRERTEVGCVNTA